MENAGTSGSSIPHSIPSCPQCPGYISGLELIVFAVTSPCGGAPGVGADFGGARGSRVWDLPLLEGVQDTSG